MVQIIALFNEAQGQAKAVNIRFETKLRNNDLNSFPAVYSLEAVFYGLLPIAQSFISVTKKGNFQMMH